MKYFKLNETANSFSYLKRKGYCESPTTAETRNISIQKILRSRIEKIYI